MKKTLAMLLAAGMVLSLAACGKKEVAPETTVEETTTVAEVEETVEDEVVEIEDDTEAETEAEVAVMTGADYLAAELDSEVCVLTYVQAHQGWWEKDGQGVCTVYSQTEDGVGVFCYNMACTAEEAEALVPGTAIQVTGYKAEWSGEVEIVDATFEFVDGAPVYIAEANDMTAVDPADYANYMNTYVKFTGLTVEAYNDAAFAYNWDGSGDHDSNSDLYFAVKQGDADAMTFTVESYLCGNDTDVYSVVEDLAIGDKITVEGFMYWYEGPQVHVTAVLVEN